jgi:GNAT superfamily N-acetyltransferase
VIRIRRAEDHELDEVLRMDRECFPDDKPPDIENVTWWVAELGIVGVSDVAVGGDLVAYAGACRAASTPEAIYLCRVGVLPIARGGGLQRRFIRCRERWGRRLGYRHAVTDTNDVASMRNLIRCGYLPFDPKAPWGRSTSTYWRRRISTGDGVPVAA